MRERYVGSVLMTGGQDHLLGIFTEPDTVCRVRSASRDADRTTLAKMMTTEVITIAPQATAPEALRHMQDGGLRHVPVVEGRRVVGIVSYTDFRGWSTPALRTKLSSSRQSGEVAGHWFADWESP